MPRLAIELLGSYQVTLDGEPLTAFEYDKVRALLAYLAVESDRAHRREALAALLWPERPEGSAGRNLNQALYTLRRAIGDGQRSAPLIDSTRRTIRFRPSNDCWLDVSEFEGLLSAADQHDHAEPSDCDPCLESLSQAEALYRGSFLEGLAVPGCPEFEEWCLLQRERLHRRALEALQQLGACLELRGDLEQGLRYARRQLELDPWLEGAHRHVMRLLARTGQRSAALMQYETCRRTLSEELDLEPAPETNVLYQRIRDGQVGESRQRDASNLPVPINPLVGRATELAGIMAALRDPDVRLLTVIGPGGSGKTRLALEAARRLVADDDGAPGFSDGLHFVSLAPVQSAQAMVSTIAQAIGLALHQEGDPKKQLLSYLRGKEMLLLLDNFEHLLDGAPLVTEILSHAPGVKALVTTRARLNLVDEQLFRLAGMRYPLPSSPGGTERRRQGWPEGERWGEGRPAAADDGEDGHSAVDLFLQGARRVQPGLQPTEADMAQIARICHLVQGMPLAILLAASWMEVLSLAQIADEISSAPDGSGLDFLRTEWRDVPERQRSMRTVFDHSWRLLSPRERDILASASVFRGGFTREAGHEVAGASLHDLLALINRSLLHRDLAGRYDMHELLRQYAATRLHERPALEEVARNRHAAYYACALERWGEALKGPRQMAALAELTREIDNAQAAWHWAADRVLIALLDRALDGLGAFYENRARVQEGLDACALAAERVRADLAAMAAGDLAPDDDPTTAQKRRVLARMLAWQSSYCLALGHVEAAGKLVQESFCLIEAEEATGRVPVAEKAFALSAKGLLFFHSDYRESIRWNEQSLALYRSIGDRCAVATLLGRLANEHRRLGAHQITREMAEERLAIYQALGNTRGIALALNLLGLLAFYRGDLTRSARLTDEAICLDRQLGSLADLEDTMRVAIAALTMLGRYAEALSYGEESLAIGEQLGLPATRAYARLGSGVARIHTGEYGKARRLALEALGLFQGIDLVWGIGSAHLALGMAALAMGEAGEASRRLRAAVETHQGTGERDLEGWALGVLGAAQLVLGNRAEAGRSIRKALEITGRIGAFLPFLYALPAAALLRIEGGDPAGAVELYAQACLTPCVATSRWFHVVFGRHVDEATAALPPQVVQAARERGRALDVQATVGALLAEL